MDETHGLDVDDTRRLDSTPLRARPARDERRRVARLVTVGAASLALSLVLGACADDSASSEWTYAPLTDTAAATSAAPVVDAPDASAPPEGFAPPGRAQPLEPPAGNVIPRFVEPERAEQPEAADAIPAPVAIEPSALPTANDAPGTQPTPTAASSARPGAGSEVTAAPSAAATGSSVVELSLVAEDIAFDTDQLTVSAGATVRLTLENRDRTPHNFAVYRTDAADEAIFVGELLTGPDTTITYEFTAPTEAGDYFFRCDVHPTVMTGTFTVE